MTDAVDACPECDAANPYKRSPDVSSPEHEYAYKCTRCQAEFNEPVRREAGTRNCIPGDTLAYRLTLTDPDEVGP